MKSKKKERGSEIDILNYHLCPKMEILDEKEKKQLLDKFNIPDFTKLPAFKVTDPAVKKLGAKPGDVIKIYRNDMTGKYIAYRYVRPEVEG